VFSRNRMIWLMFFKFDIWLHECWV